MEPEEVVGGVGASLSSCVGRGGKWAYFGGDAKLPWERNCHGKTLWSLASGVSGLPEFLRKISPFSCHVPSSLSYNILPGISQVRMGTECRKASLTSPPSSVPTVSLTRLMIEKFSPHHGSLSPVSVLPEATDIPRDCILLNSYLSFLHLLPQPVLLGDSTSCVSKIYPLFQTPPSLTWSRAQWFFASVTVVPPLFPHL